MNEIEQKQLHKQLLENQLKYAKERKEENKRLINEMMKQQEDPPEDLHTGILFENQAFSGETTYDFLPNEDYYDFYKCNGYGFNAVIGDIDNTDFSFIVYINDRAGEDHPKSFINKLPLYVIEYWMGSMLRQIYFVNSHIDFNYFLKEMKPTIDCAKHQKISYSLTTIESHLEKLLENRA